MDNSAKFHHFHSVYMDLSIPLIPCINTLIQALKHFLLCNSCTWLNILKICKRNFGCILFYIVIGGYPKPNAQVQNFDLKLRTVHRCIVVYKTQIGSPLKMNEKYKKYLFYLYKLLIIIYKIIRFVPRSLCIKKDPRTS